MVPPRFVIRRRLGTVPDFLDHPPTKEKSKPAPLKPTRMWHPKSLPRQSVCHPPPCAYFLICELTVSYLVRTTEVSKEEPIITRAARHRVYCAVATTSTFIICASLIFPQDSQAYLKPRSKKGKGCFGFIRRVIFS